jgi:Icc-related predicted phosphoesterase
MRRFLLAGGVHGNKSALGWLRELINQRRPDALLFAGGVLHPDRLYVPAMTEWGMTRDDALFLEHFFETLGGLDVFTAIIPGPFDTPLEDFLHLGMCAEVESPSLHLAHATLIEADGLVVGGIGGCLAEDGSLEPDMLTRIRANYFLRTLNHSRRSRKVLLLPAAPPSLGAGPEGRLIDALIDSHPVDLCVVAGPTDHRGSQQVARTLIVNPGCLNDGSAAWVDCGHDDGAVEFLDWQSPLPRAQVFVTNLEYGSI